MAKILLGTGNFTWDAVERRTDRYGSVRLTNNANNSNVTIDSKFDALEGKIGILFAEVVTPVKSPHMGDLRRGFKISLPEKGEIVNFGRGELFIEHRGKAPHERNMFELLDAEMMTKMKAAFQQMGMKVKGFDTNYEEPEIYDLIGLKPEDGRTKDWLNPQAFYRLHLSKVKLYFEEI